MSHSALHRGSSKAALLAFVLLAVSISMQAQGVGGPSMNSAMGAPAGKQAPDLSNVGIDQKLNAQVPLDIPFKDENGQPVTLKKYFNGKPVILSLVYFNCPMLCPEVLDGMSKTLKLVKFDIGKDYQVLTVSFDPSDTPQSAAEKKAVYVRQLGAPGAAQGWHFLTGNQASIQALTQAVGFRYKWLPESHQFAHATAIMVLTPEGKVSKYFYGAQFNPTDMRFGLIQASDHKIGTPVDAVLLYCCRYNSVTGKYDLIVSRLLAIAGAATILILGSFLIILFKFGPSSKKKAAEKATASHSG